MAGGDIASTGRKGLARKSRRVPASELVSTATHPYPGARVKTPRAEAERAVPDGEGADDDGGGLALDLEAGDDGDGDGMPLEPGSSDDSAPRGAKAIEDPLLNKALTEATENKS